MTSALDQQALCPSVNVLIGKRQPVFSARESKRQLDTLCLDLEPGTPDHESLLLASTALPVSRPKKRSRCCSSMAETLMEGTMSCLELETLVYSRLLYFFADIFCFHSYGLSDLARIGRWIATWSLQEHAGWKPSLVIVLADKYSQGSNAASIAERLLATTVETITSLPLSSYFFETTFLQIPETDSPNDFRTHLHRCTSTVRQRRQDAGLCFSVEHFNALFERAFESAAALTNQPFDPVRSARQDLPVSIELTDHLVNYMNQIPLARDLLSFASPVIASSLLLDHYVPDMHRESLLGPAGILL